MSLCAYTISVTSAIVYVVLAYCILMCRCVILVHVACWFPHLHHDPDVDVIIIAHSTDRHFAQL